MQASESLYKERGGAGFEVVEVLVENASGGRPTADDLGLWIKYYGVTFTVVADPDKTAFTRYVPSHALPTYFVIDAEGVIRYVAVGAADDPGSEQRLRDAIDAAGGRAPSDAATGG